MTDTQNPPEEKRKLKGPLKAGVGRGALRVKTNKTLKESSKNWMRRHLSDPYVHAAKAAGWRSRAAFKLIELNDKFRFLKHGQRVVDLGCAPGGWTQVVVKRGAVAVVGIDLLPVEHIEGATLLQMDFMAPEAPEALMQHLGGKADIVMSDMAPNTTGHRETDHLRILGLAEMAIEFACANLSPGGVFITKLFQGAGSQELMTILKTRFDTVRHAKPKASRVESSESYIVAMGFRG
jgi:23S rRNA (uridine2552-2'-O)-methyltransferase